MGILKSLFTLGKSMVSQAGETIEEAQGVRILEQHIRDAKSALDKAGQSRVDLLARVKLSNDKLQDLRARKDTLEARALEALNKNVAADLINEVATEIARLENEIAVEERVLANLEFSRDGVEQAVHATAQRIAQFEQQLEVVKATEAMQRAQQAVTTSTLGASSRVSTAAESLRRLQTRQAERQARLDAAAQLERWRMEATLLRSSRKPALVQPTKARLRMYWHVFVNNRANDCGPTVSSVLMGESLRSGHGPFFQRLFAKRVRRLPYAVRWGYILKRVLRWIPWRFVCWRITF